jgi:hypothetical protein
MPLSSTSAFGCLPPFLAVACICAALLADPTDRGLPICVHSTSLGAILKAAVPLWYSEWQVTHRMYLWWEGCCSFIVEQVL